jgi:hypothetical protein
MSAGSSTGRSPRCGRRGLGSLRCGCPTVGRSVRSTAPHHAAVALRLDGSQMSKSSVICEDGPPEGPVRQHRSPSAPVVKLGRVSMRAKPWEVPDGLWERVDQFLPGSRSGFGPLAWMLTGGNRNGVTELIGPARSRAAGSGARGGRPRRRPKALSERSLEVGANRVVDHECATALKCAD